MRVLIDADATIKLHRSGVLARLVDAFHCVMPQSVYDEIVTQGKERMHQDAETIEATIAGAVTIVQTLEHQQPEMGLGDGELGILDALGKETDPIVVSDDRRFLTLLTMRGIPFLTPADVLVLLSRQNIITRAEAIEALEHLRPLIRIAAYHEAREDL